MTTRPIPHRALWIATLAAAATMMTACNRADDNRTAGTTGSDTPVASSGSTGSTAGGTTGTSGTTTSSTDSSNTTTSSTATTTPGVAGGQPAAVPGTTSTADGMGQRMDQAAGTAASKVEDAAITAGVNAELAKDNQLSALQINVDTAGGRVTLSGKAPDSAARERATQLASAVKGVTGVDNRLQVGS